MQFHVDLSQADVLTGSIPVGGTKFKAAKVHNLPAFFFFPSADLNSKCAEVHGSVPQSGGIWGHIFKNWGHISDAPSFASWLHLPLATQPLPSST